MSTDDDRPSTGASSWLARVAHLGVRALGHGAHHAATTWADTKKAYRQGRDPNVEEAKVIEEREGRRESGE